MSSAQDEHAAVRKAAFEGHRLFSAGDYQGAIAACTEAIRLEPGSVGAKRTLRQAKKRLEAQKLDPQERAQELELRRREMRTLHPVRLPPTGDRQKTFPDSGFMFILLPSGLLGFFMLMAVAWSDSAGRATFLLLSGGFFIGLPLEVVRRHWGYLLIMLWRSLAVKFYLNQATATVSQETLRSGDEFEFSYRLSFKRRTEVRRFRVQLVVREVESYEFDAGEETRMREKQTDKVVQTAERLGWRGKPGENFCKNVTLRIPDSPPYSGQWLIQVRIGLSELVTLERYYPLHVRWR